MGIVSDRDLKEATPSKATTLDIHEMYHLLDTITVKSLMPKNLYTITPGDTVEKPRPSCSNTISRLCRWWTPKATLAGILTKGDVFRAFVSISGIYQGPLAMGLELPDQPGYIKQVTDVIREHGGRIASIMTRYEGAPEGFKRVYIRAKEVKDEKALRERTGGQAQDTLLFQRESRLIQVISSACGSACGSQAVSIGCPREQQFCPAVFSAHCPLIS